MRLVHWVVTTPVAVVAVLFAVSNRDTAIVGLWPLPGSLAAPLYLVVLVALVVGFLVGGFVTWVSGGRVRRVARERARRVATLERELAQAEAKLAAARDPATPRINAGA